MGRRYYCDYCDKTFIDDLDARKKHLFSSHHIKLRKLHYEMHRGNFFKLFYLINEITKLFLDLKAILQEESVKTPCRRFFQNGDCQFAGNCKYTHYSQTCLWEIKQQSMYKSCSWFIYVRKKLNVVVDYQEAEKRKKAQQAAEMPSYESWLEKYYQKHNEENSEDRITPFWTYPDYLETRTDLPPSLQKFKPEDFLDDDFEEWGA